MKKMLKSLLLAMLLLIPACVLAEESAADTLLMQELTEWAARYQARAIASKPLNDPKKSLTSEGYEFIYDFATLYADKPVMKADTVVSAVVVTSSEEEGPRGVCVDDTMQVALSAFYTENAELRGSRSNAVIYLIDLMPESLQWAEVQRDGQRVHTIQYAVHDQLTSGGDGYTDAGLILTMQDGLVSAIRAYGLNARISFDQAYDMLSQMRAAAQAQDYVQVETSYDGAALSKFDGADLLFPGADFTSLTPETAVSLWGSALSDVSVDDGDAGVIRTMTFSDCEITFLADAKGNDPKVYMLLLTTGGMEGPRAVRLGDTFHEVYNRFRNGEGAFDGVSREVLYGSEASGEFGVAEYGADASATLRYGLVLEDGSRVVLHMAFTAMELTEVMLYMAE